MNTGTLPRFPVQSETQLYVASKYSCFNFGTFCTVGGRRLLITEILSWKDTISSHSESNSCVLSQHIGKKGDQLCMQVKRIYTAHIQDLTRRMMVQEQDWRLLFPKEDVSLSSILVMAHEIHCTKHTTHCPSNIFSVKINWFLFRWRARFHTQCSFNIPIWLKKVEITMMTWTVQIIYGCMRSSFQIWSLYQLLWSTTWLTTMYSSTGTR